MACSNPVKLGLAEDCITETIQIMVENGKAHLVSSLLQIEFFCQEIFIGGGGNLCQENRIVAIDIGLIFSGIHGVHGMARYDQGIEIYPGYPAS